VQHHCHSVALGRDGEGRQEEGGDGKFMTRTSQQRWGRAFAVLAVAAAALCIVAAVLDAGRMAAGDFHGEEPAGTSELLLAGGGRVLGLRRVVPRTTGGFFGEDAAIFGQRHERGGPKRASEAAQGDDGAEPGEEEGSIASGGEGGDAPKEDGGGEVEGGAEDKEEDASEPGGEASKEEGESPPPKDANEFGIEPDDAVPAKEGDGAAPGKLGDGDSGKLKGVIGDDGEDEEEGQAEYEEPVWGETPPPGRSTEFLRGLVGQVEADETMPAKASKKLKLSEKTVEAAEQQLAVAKRMRMDAAAEREQAATLSKHLGAICARRLSPRAIEGRGRARKQKAHISKPLRNLACWLFRPRLPRFFSLLARGVCRQVCRLSLES
jgi:hypothetical protein